MKRRMFHLIIVCIMVTTTLLSSNEALLFAKGATEAKEIVNPKQVYTYEIMTQDIKKLADQYPDIIEYQSIGKTVFGRDIWAVKLGKGDGTVFLNGSFHAREWMTTNLLMYMIEQYTQKYERNEEFEGYPVREILDQVSIWFVPMVNPDGVTLQQKGVSAFPKEDQAKLIKMNGGSKDFKRWKANAEGIDLNRQWPANWEYLSKKISSPYYMNYNGTKPLSTNETKAIYHFTYEIDPEIVVAYHSSGRILYWHYNTKPDNVERDKKIADQLAAYTGYRLVAPIHSKGSGGGYKDWFIQEFGRLGFTPEISYYVGETNPPISIFDEVWKRNKWIGLYIAHEGEKLWYPKFLAKIKVEIDGQLQSFEQDPVMVENRVLVPFRSIFESFGADIRWDGDNQIVYATKDDIQLVIPINSKQVRVGETTYELEVPATIINGKTMVPVRFVTEALKADVKWEDSTNTVKITTDSKFVNS